MNHLTRETRRIISAADGVARRGGALRQEQDARALARCHAWITWRWGLEILGMTPDRGDVRLRGLSGAAEWRTVPPHARPVRDAERWHVERQADFNAMLA